MLICGFAAFCFALSSLFLAECQRNREIYIWQISPFRCASVEDDLSIGV